jgi:uncharacterized protein YuzE
MLTKIRRTREGRGVSNLRFEYYPDTDSLYIELNPGRKRKTGGSQEVVGQGNRDIVIDADGDGVPVGIDIDSFASEIVDLTKLEAEGPIFGLARVGGQRDGLVSTCKTVARADSGVAQEAGGGDVWIAAVGRQHHVTLITDRGRGCVHPMDYH